MAQLPPRSVHVPLSNGRRRLPYLQSEHTMFSVISRAINALQSCSRDRGDTLDSCSDVEVHARIGLRMYLRQSRGLSCAARKTVVKRTFENPFRASYPINLFCKSSEQPPPLPSFQNYRQRFQAVETFSCMLLRRSRPPQRVITLSRCFFRLSPAAPSRQKFASGLIPLQTVHRLLPHTSSLWLTSRGGSYTGQAGRE